MLYLHCGGKEVTMNDLENYEVPTLEELREARGDHVVGSRWKPVPHINLVKTVRHEIMGRGLRIHEEHYGWSKDTHTLFASISLKSYVPGTNRELGMQFGLRSDNLQRVKLYGVTGGKVFICDNMSIAGQFAFGHKHTTGLDLGELVHQGFSTYVQQTREMHTFVQGLRDVRLDTETGDALLVEACHRGILPSSQIVKVSTEWREPRHDVFKERNGWSLYNCLTEIAKQWVVNTHETALRDFPALILED